MGQEWKVRPEGKARTLDSAFCSFYSFGPKMLIGRLVGAGSECDDSQRDLGLACSRLMTKAWASTPSLGLPRLLLYLRAMGLEVSDRTWALPKR